jgi:hypothetical protein
MLQAYPYHTGQTVINYLTASTGTEGIDPGDILPMAKTAGNSTENNPTQLQFPNNYWGWGRVDAEQAINNIASIDNRLAEKAVFVNAISNGQMLLQLNFAAPVDIDVQLFDLSGRLLNQISLDNAVPGSHRLDFGKSYSSGLYMLKITDGNFEWKNKTILIK